MREVTIALQDAWNAIPKDSPERKKYWDMVDKDKERYLQELKAVGLKPEHLGANCKKYYFIESGEEGEPSNEAKEEEPVKQMEKEGNEASSEDDPIPDDPVKQESEGDLDNNFNDFLNSKSKLA